MPVNEALAKAQKKYREEHQTLISFRFYRTSNKDILDRLEQEQNRSGFIKKLIREDIQRHKEG